MSISRTQTGRNFWTFRGRETQLAVLAMDDGEIDVNELRALSERLAVAVDRTDRKPDANLAEIARLREHLRDRDTLKAATLADLRESGQEWQFRALASVRREETDEVEVRP